MRYLSCKAEDSVITCRSISNVAEMGGNVEDKAETEVWRNWRGNRSIQVFPYSDLESATSYFSDERLLGRGSHGSVYRAVIKPPGYFVAVKRPSRSQNFLVLDRNEVENEIEILSKIYNPRLVNLIGFSTYEEVNYPPNLNSSSVRRRERLLVVEYMPNGNLYELLHSNSRPPGWRRRIQLALQTAKAIHALHSCSPPIIHRDVKSANVLIDSDFNARLGDFGLALIAAEEGEKGDLVLNSPSLISLRSTPPAGTLGYLDPGYITPENLSTKTDVFSFGILLFEIISGRKAIDVAHSPPSVVEWAVPLLRKGKVLSLYDPRISPPRDPSTRKQLACLAASCVRSSKDKRPSMEEVIVCLKILYKSLSSKNWTSNLSVRNPCLMVEAVDITKLKNPSSIEIEEAASSSPDRGSSDSFERETTTRKSPSSSKAVHPIRNARDLSKSSGSMNGRNLMDLMLAPDSETLKFIGSCPQRSIIRRQMAVRLNHSTRNVGVQLKVDEVNELDNKIGMLKVEII